jgi:hypothetical protein
LSTKYKNSGRNNKWFIFLRTMAQSAEVPKNQGSLVYVCVYIYIYIYIYVCVCIYICMCVYIYTYICVYTHIYTKFSLYLYIYVQIHTYMHIHIYHRILFSHKEKLIMSFAGKWMELEIMVLSKINKAQKSQIPYVLAHFFILDLRW